MTGNQYVLESDLIINPFSWNTVVLRDGHYYSINHYRSCISQTTGSYLPERFEVRYKLEHKRDWSRLQVKRPVS